uniref:SprT-like domain-containing protein n=1 Tax=Chromera velia CCMP2878 TaxID=1169474 RepID=A0A0G4G9G6_9ALVE|mmetsp:Transcript_30648/g.60311  ORF Transcript_30648/g.60311 Transcript_30648/m.60311 type:complete len:525 (-) Transcript_30648:542-2116(-)|eukprot:Cvel_20883.t1-p1 / transcript=Cvel_20883.t1 / gene=Cvel_20883 / organism=Chromera_velia_CCMP2878 / gene_product=hypothetical protein / transcript_product=hypothetical protein / location=Cvel_scaffold1914:23619-26999(-) / protein_length=524 / sequence_SO=supercontig / SO=protein_coding / is_pseudo=false
METPAKTEPLPPERRGERPQHSPPVCNTDKEDLTGSHRSAQRVSDPLREEKNADSQPVGRSSTPQSAVSSTCPGVTGDESQGKDPVLDTGFIAPPSSSQDRLAVQECPSSHGTLGDSHTKAEGVLETDCHQMDDEEDEEELGEEEEEEEEDWFEDPDDFHVQKPNAAACANTKQQKKKRTHSPTSARREPRKDPSDSQPRSALSGSGGRREEKKAREKDSGKNTASGGSGSLYGPLQTQSIRSQRGSEGGDSQTLLRDLSQIIVLLSEALPLLRPVCGLKLMATRGGQSNVFHGWCHYEVSKWREETDGSFRAETWSVEHVKLFVSHPDGTPVRLEMILATFLHELAHCVTVPRKVRRPDGSWDRDDHGAEFYAHFGAILRVAEDLDIFRVPSRPGKFSRAALERYDQISPDTLVGSIGSSVRLQSLPTFREMVLVESSRAFSVRLAERSRPSVVKAAVLEPPFSVEGLLKLGRQKFNMKTKPTTAECVRKGKATGSGEQIKAVTDQALQDRAEIPVDALILIS